MSKSENIISCGSQHSICSCCTENVKKGAVIHLNEEKLAYVIHLVLTHLSDALFLMSAVPRAEYFHGSE